MANNEESAGQPQPEAEHQEQPTQSQPAPPQPPPALPSGEPPQSQTAGTPPAEAAGQAAQSQTAQTPPPEAPGDGSQAKDACPPKEQVKHRRLPAIAVGVIAGLTIAPLGSAITLILIETVQSPGVLSLDAAAFAAAAGFAVAVVLGVVAFLYLWWRATANGINGRQYGELSARLSGLWGSLQDARQQAEKKADPVLCGWEIVKLHACAVEDLLARRSLFWVTGEAYINAWSELHRAEEAFFLCAPKAAIVNLASDDEMRLFRSDMPNSDMLVSKLKTAVVTVSKAAAAYLPTPASSPQSTEPTDAYDSAIARAVLQDVRFSINQYRDGIWEGLINAKNLLLAKVATGWVITYIALLIVVLAHAPVKGTVSAALFFLTGALVGGISDITQQSLTQSAVEDYGLSKARIAATSLISGAAAVIGVVIVAILGLSAVGAPLTSVASAASASRAAPGIPPWSTVFDWSQNPVGFAVAAVFGFAPSRLFDLLRGDQSAATQQLKKSQSTGSSS